MQDVSIDHHGDEGRKMEEKSTALCRRSSCQRLGVRDAGWGFRGHQQSSFCQGRRNRKRRQAVEVEVSPRVALCGC